MDPKKLEQYIKKLNKQIKQGNKAREELISLLNVLKTATVRPAKPLAVGEIGRPKLERELIYNTIRANRHLTSKELCKMLGIAKSTFDVILREMGTGLKELRKNG